MSFYVKSSVTGTFSVGIYKADNTAVISNKTYTINSANTWEYKTVTFTANTTNDAINNDNGIGFYVNWHLAAGSTYTGGGSLTDWNNYGGSSFWANGQATNALFTTNGSTWQLTGCQLEVGEATPFEHEPTSVTLAKCQRYYYAHIQSGNATQYVGMGEMYTTTQLDLNVHLPVSMRASPTLVQSSGTNYWRGYGGNGSLLVSNNWTLWLSNSTNTVVSHYVTAASSSTAGFAMRVINDSTSAALAYDAEL